MSYFVPQKIKRRIEGNCIKCGRCCGQIRAYGMKSEKEFNFMKIFFPFYKYFYITGCFENGDLKLACKHIGEDNLCRIYDKRPNMCKNYPSKYVYANIEMIDGCGYKVIKKSFQNYLNKE